MFTMNKQLEGFDGLPARDKACIVLKQVFGEATGRVPNGIDAFVDHVIDASLYALQFKCEDMKNARARELLDSVDIQPGPIAYVGTYLYDKYGGEDAKADEAAAGDVPLLEEMAQGAAGEAGAEQLPEGAAVGTKPATIQGVEGVDGLGYSRNDAERFTTHEGVASKPGWTDGA